FDWPKDGKLIVGGLKSNVTKAYLLADQGKTALKTTRLNELDLQIDALATPNSADTVMVLNCDGDIACDPARLIQPACTNTLRAFDGDLHGKAMRFGPGKKTDAYVTQWSRPDESISWNVRVTEPATLGASILYDGANAGGTYAVRIGSQSLK